MQMQEGIASSSDKSAWHACSELLANTAAVIVLLSAQADKPRDVVSAARALPLSATRRILHVHCCPDDDGSAEAFRADVQTRMQQAGLECVFMGHFSQVRQQSACACCMYAVHL